MNGATAQTERRFTAVADETTIDKTAAALEANGFAVRVVDDANRAIEVIKEIIPEGAEVYTNTSRTTEDTGIRELLDESGSYRSVREQTKNLEYGSRDLVKAWSTPEYMVGSVHALTEDGHALIASRSNSQLAGYANGAEHVVWVVGAQKIVPSVEEGMERITEHVVPLEDKRVKQVYGPGQNTKMNSILIKYAEDKPRTTIILLKQAAGF